MEFSVEVDHEHDVPVVRIKGEVDVYTCPQLNETLTELIDENHHHLIINLEAVDYIDSTGLGTIAYSAKQLERENGDIHIVCSRPQVKKVFEISGLSKRNIQLFEQEKAALDQVG